MIQPLEKIIERAARLSAAGQKAALREFKKIIARIEANEQAGQSSEAQPANYDEPFPVYERVAGLGKGSIHMAPDFDAPLPDSFWLGEE